MSVYIQYYYSVAVVLKPVRGESATVLCRVSSGDSPETGQC